MNDEHNEIDGNNTPVHNRQVYDQAYFEKHCGSIPYRWDIPHWPKFFGEVAETLNQRLKPSTVLDVGCACGFLVDAFWRRGVRAYGIDISEYAISQVPQDVASFCRVLSATDPLPEDFPQTYDLITCIEVLEHIPQEDARAAIKKMASRTDCILFSSTPHDLTEPTHVNVRPIIYWLQLFAEVGFYPDLRFDASFVCPQAFLVRKGMPRLQEDALPFFSESINKKFQIQAQLEQIAGLARSNQELGDEVGKRDREIENLRQESARLNDDRRELEESLRREHVNRQDLEESLRREHVNRHDLEESLQSIREQLQSSEKDKLGLRVQIDRLQETAKRNEAELRGERDRLQRTQADQEAALVGLRQSFEREVSERDSKIAVLQLAQSGLLWDAVVFYRKAKDRCFPPSTRRRMLYDYGLQAVKTVTQRARLSRGLFLAARHPVKTLKNFNRVNVDKFFYHVQHSDAAVLEAKLERKLGLDQPVSLPTRAQKFALIISGCPGDAFRYRCEHQAEQLRFFGLTVDIAYFDQIEYRDVLDNYQCYWLHRVPHTQAVEEFIRSAQEMGKPVIFDTDDLIFDEEKISYVRALQWMSPDEADLYCDGVRRYHRTLSLCRIATVTTEPLREAVRRLFPQIQCFLNPNALSDAQVAQADEALSFGRPPEDENIVRIAYLSGTRTHNIDFQECSGALKRILEAHPHVRLMVVGHLDVGSEFDRFGERIERYPLLPWQQLPGLLRNVDINLAPLELDNPFTESKSALKYFEAAVMGVPTVGSDVAPFRTAIRQGEKNGYLCRTEEDWARCLTQLAEDRESRTRMGAKARAEALETLTTRRGAANLVNIIKEIFRANQPNSEKTLSIAFVLRAPIAQVGGGYKVIFLLADYLASRGHAVHLYVEAIAHLEGKPEAEIIEFCHTHFGRSPAKIHVGHHAIEPSDIAIATNWPTAFVVDRLINTRCKAYLIQDFETEFYQADDPLRKEVEKTYDLPLKKICIGRYLSDLFTVKDRLPIAHFDFPLDHEIFHAVGRKTSSPITVLFFARPSLKRRGYDIGIPALEKVHREFPDVRFCMYGMEESPSLPFPYTNLGLLDHRQVAQAMRESDIHLSFSLSNISQVPFQAMACGCAVVEAKVPSVEAMVEDGKNCVLAEPERNAVAAALVRLIEDGGLRQRVATSGMEFVREKTWDNACKQFEDIVLDALPSTENDGGRPPAVTSNGLYAVPSASKHEPDLCGSTGETADRGVYYRSCNFCGEKEFRVFKRLDTPFPNQIYGDQKLSYPDVGKHLTLQYLECMDCGLVGINPLTRFSDINRSSFDGEKNIVAWADIDYAVYEADKRNQIRLIYDQYEFERYRRTNRILDVSCGPGVSLSWLRDEKSWNVFGVDPDRHSVRTAWNRYGLEIQNGLIDQIGGRDEYFDVIIMDNSLEYTFDPNSTLLKTFRLLRKGGGLFVAVPNSHGLSTKYLNANAHWGHWFLFSPRVAFNFLSLIGFVVARIYAFQESVDQAIIDQGRDIQPYKDRLRISLLDEVEISAQIEKGGFFSDYFHLMARKPLQSGVSVDCETTLLSIAHSSLQQLARVTINEGPEPFIRAK